MQGTSRETSTIPPLKLKLEADIALHDSEILKQCSRWQVGIPNRNNEGDEAGARGDVERLHCSAAVPHGRCSVGRYGDGRGVGVGGAVRGAIWAVFIVCAVDPPVGALGRDDLVRVGGIRRYCYQCDVGWDLGCD